MIAYHYLLIKDGDMFFYRIQLFILIFCVLIVIKNIFNVAKVMYMREGKVESGKWTLLSIGLSISYIMTIIIAGFQ